MNDLEYYNSFEERLQLELLKLCNSLEALDPVLAESEDITEKWNDYATPYMADAIEQVNDYPNASIAWPAFMGMAVAQWWDTDWLANSNNPYEKFYGVEGWDDMDLYSRRQWLETDNEGTQRREYVCTLEVWAEALGGNPDRLDRYAGKEIREILEKMPEWKHMSDNKRLRRPYGKQRYYRRT